MHWFADGASAFNSSGDYVEKSSDKVQIFNKNYKEHSGETPLDLEFQKGRVMAQAVSSRPLNAET
jgi:hypothetical protein